MNATVSRKVTRYCLEFQCKASESLYKSATKRTGKKRAAVFKGVSIRDDAPESYMDVLEDVPENSWTVLDIPIRDRVACR